MTSLKEIYSAKLVEKDDVIAKFSNKLNIAENNVIHSERARKEAEAIRDSVAKNNERLKQKVLELTEANARLNGYLARVREDDTVREEMIATGNSDEQTLVPKRKDYLNLPMYANVGIDDNYDRAMDADNRGYINYESQDKQKRKHWVNY